MPAASSRSVSSVPVSAVPLIVSLAVKSEAAPITKVSAPRATRQWSEPAPPVIVSSPAPPSHGRRRVRRPPGDVVRTAKIRPINDNAIAAREAQRR